MKKIAQQDNNYQVDIKPRVHLPSSFYTKTRLIDVEDVDKVTIPFTIDIEARNWGIKWISVSIPRSQITLDVNFSDSTTSQDGTETVNEYAKKIVFDPSQIKLQLTSGGEITIYALTITLNDDFTVNYEDSYFEGHSLMQGD